MRVKFMHYYIHIPFCRQKCPYCKFALTPIFDEVKKRRYIAYLKEEIRGYFASVAREEQAIQEKNTNSFSWLDRHASLAMTETRTIYFGWGTPSVLSHDELQSILECFPDYRRVSEISFESNPEDITGDYVRGLLDLGVTRLSMWVQTVNDRSLKEIHRSSKKSIYEALESIRRALEDKKWNKGSEISQKQEIQGRKVFSKGVYSVVSDWEINFSNDEVRSFSEISINVDFILGLPYTLPWEILEWIQELHKKFPFITHTSVYMLEDEEYPKHWKEKSIRELELQKEFLDIMKYFESIGWHHYELSNFAKPWYESKHNQSYWDHSPYRGFGLSASSFEWKRRWSNSSSFAGYYRWEKENEETLTPETLTIENIMFGMRRNGVEKSLLQENKYKPLITEWLIEIRWEKLFPTKTWIFLLDHIMGELI